MQNGFLPQPTDTNTLGGLTAVCSQQAVRSHVDEGLGVRRD